MDFILKYFPHLSPLQVAQLEQLGALYSHWNAQINVISRKDIDNLYLHHVLHSLAVAKFVNFKNNTQILDAGTGGGFPGIPLAVFFPNVKFTLLDSIGKKIKVASEIASAIGLNNVKTKHLRLEQETEKYDFVISRAVMPLGEMVKLVRGKILSLQHNAIPNGVICLKGGDLSAEIQLSLA